MVNAHTQFRIGKKVPKKKCHKKALCTDGMLEKSTGEGRV